jgi:hypothetical protein
MRDVGLVRELTLVPRLTDRPIVTVALKIKLLGGSVCANGKVQQAPRPGIRHLSRYSFGANALRFEPLSAASGA